MEPSIGLKVKEYFASSQPPSVFDDLAGSGAAALLHRCDTTDSIGVVAKNGIYDLTFRQAGATEGTPETVLPKLDILYVCAPDAQPAIRRQTKTPLRAAEPLRKAVDRNHIKNKTLHPLMETRTVVYLTLLDSTVIRGIVTGFNRYEMRISLKGDIPVVVLRHGILTAETKDGHSILRRDIPSRIRA